MHIFNTMCVNILLPLVHTYVLRSKKYLGFQNSSLVILFDLNYNITLLLSVADTKKRD